MYRIVGAAPLNGSNMVSRKKLILVGMITPLDLQNFWTKVYRTFLAERRRNRGKSHTCPTLNIFIRSADIRHQTLKSAEIVQKFA